MHIIGHIRKSQINMISIHPQITSSQNPERMVCINITVGSSGAILTVPF